MPKQRPPKRDKQRTGRLKDRAQDRLDGSSAEDEAMDAAIKRSIDDFGA
jgi:hypothetical protein